MVQEEGLESGWLRHELHHKAFAAGIQAMGLDLVVDANCRLPQLNAVQIPSGIDEAAVRRELLQTWNLEIGAGLGSLAGKVWRVGLMGHAARHTNVLLCLTALTDTLRSMGAAVNADAAVTAAKSVYTNG